MDSLVNVSIVVYISFTFLFFVLKYRFFPEKGYIWILAFVALSGLIQFFQNLNLTSSYCGEADFKLAVYSTVVPWIVIFTVFVFALTTLPGWLRVFSNTFGLFAADAYGLKTVIGQVFQPANTENKDRSFLNMIDQIYSNKTALVVEMDIDNVIPEGKDTSFRFPALEELIKMNIIQQPLPELQKKLYDVLLLKENVGYFFWFLLVGIFCILVSTNTLLSSTCSPKKSNYSSIFK